MLQLVLLSWPLTPVTPLEDCVLLNAVVAISPGPPVDVDFRPGPLPEFASITHGAEPEQVVNGTAPAPACELAVVPKNKVAAAIEAASAPNRFTLNIIKTPSVERWNQMRPPAGGRYFLTGDCARL